MVVGGVVVIVVVTLLSASRSGRSSMAQSCGRSSARHDPASNSGLANAGIGLRDSPAGMRGIGSRPSRREGRSGHLSSPSPARGVWAVGKRARGSRGCGACPHAWAGVGPAFRAAVVQPSVAFAHTSECQSPTQQVLAMAPLARAPLHCHVVQPAVTQQTARHSAGLCAPLFWASPMQRPIWTDVGEREDRQWTCSAAQSQEVGGLAGA